jgi:aldose 1-epimerase
LKRKRRVPAPSLQRRPFGTLPDGRAVDEYTLDNGCGLSLSVINWGGIVTAIRVPDRHGAHANVVLGFARLADYIERNPHLGTLVGRYANRIAGARFELDGQTHVLAANEGPNLLHGGTPGFGACWWNIDPEPPAADGSVALRLHRVSPAGEQGFPGTLNVSVRYTLRAQREWRIAYRATCDRATVLNLSHHGYFNLAGTGSALGQRLLLAASRYTTIDAQLIPLELAPVEGTPFDFRQATPIAQRIAQPNAQLALAQGYDHNWVLDRSAPSIEPGLCLAARLHCEQSGRTMELHTTEPAIQFYSGNFLDGTLLGAGGAHYQRGAGICLEPQHYPNSPNRPDFPSTVLRPREVYSSTSVYRFGVA